ncbi:hypothetical protein BHM03_00046776 [Ensete ventricosum]|nr:hypothetical protein BHM03_00046776 [Ensete ventricosum]
MWIGRYRTVPLKSTVNGRLKEKSIVGGRLKEKSIVGDRLGKKNGRGRRKKKRRRGKVPCLLALAAREPRATQATFLPAWGEIEATSTFLPVRYWYHTGTDKMSVCRYKLVHKTLVRRVLAN